MSEKYLLDRNVTITGDLTVNNLITVSEKVSGTAIKNLSELAGKDGNYEGDLVLDYLFIFDKFNFELNVLGNTTTMKTGKMVSITLNS